MYRNLMTSGARGDWRGSSGSTCRTVALAARAGGMAAQCGAGTVAGLQPSAEPAGRTRTCGMTCAEDCTTVSKTLKPDMQGHQWHPRVLVEGNIYPV